MGRRLCVAKQLPAPEIPADKQEPFIRLTDKEIVIVEGSTVRHKH